MVQEAAEPPGLDLTASPASAIAAVVFYNVQECLVKVDRHGKIVPWLAERWHHSWGLMLKEAQNFLSLSPSCAIFPGGAIAVTVLGLNLLGDGPGDLLDPKAA